MNRKPSTNVNTFREMNRTEPTRKEVTRVLDFYVGNGIITANQYAHMMAYVPSGKDN